MATTTIEIVVDRRERSDARWRCGIDRSDGLDPARWR
jgi:hypothetical protein